jgi:membrane protein required for colicin V production
LSWVDLVIVAVLALVTFRAFVNGLIREVVTLVAVIFGVLIAGFLYDDLSANLEFLINDDPTRDLISFIAIFAGIVVAGQIGGTLLKQTAGLLLLGPLDHVGGAVFGFIKGILLVQMALIAFAVFPAVEFISRGVDDSRLAPFFLETIPIAGVGLPSEFDTPLDDLEVWRERLAALLRSERLPAP